jgi:flagellar biosynthesis/type III secretory pathway protein FliH
MKDLSRSSKPFAFDDLSVENQEGARAVFVKLFSEADHDEPSDLGETLSEEDRTRMAFEDAYVQGEKAGFEMGMRKAESIAKRLEKQIVEVASFTTELRERYENLSTELALVFAEAIILRECEASKEIIAAMIRKALETCEERSGIVIRVRNEDAGHLEYLATERLQIIKDESLKEPGFVIETNVGDLDGRISTQIEELRASVIGYHGG